MAYSELIKDISRIRDYMREFFVYGFKNRDEIGGKSARSYDNERRRLESWLGECMTFHQDANGKNVFISVDSRHVLHNPLYQAWKAKSFTKNDITLHFWLLDILSADEPKTLPEIINTIDRDYLSFFEDADPFDESTLRKKIKEYVDLGLITAEKKKKQLLYTFPIGEIHLQSWMDAVAFFTGENPLGVIGSFLEDKYDCIPQYFSFKHNYLLFASDSGITRDLLAAIHERRRMEIDVFPNKRRIVLPLKIFISTQGGRQYVVCCNTRSMKVMFVRLDSIRKVKALDVVSDYDVHLKLLDNFREHLWGVSCGQEGQLEYIEMTLEIKIDERHIVQRLEREKRCGRVERMNNTLWRFTADVYDAQEMLPWLRTFTGRIVSLTCSNKAVEERFQTDLSAMAKFYGGDGDAV